MNHLSLLLSGNLGSGHQTSTANGYPASDLASMSSLTHMGLPINTSMMAMIGNDLDSLNLPESMPGLDAAGLDYASQFTTGVTSAASIANATSAADSLGTLAASQYPANLASELSAESVVAMAGRVGMDMIKKPQPATQQAPSLPPQHQQHHAQSLPETPKSNPYSGPGKPRPTPKNLSSWSSLAQSPVPAPSTAALKTSASDSFAQFKKVAKEKQTRQRQILEQQEQRRMQKEAVEKERARQEAEKERARLEEEGLERAHEETKEQASRTGFNSLGGQALMQQHSDALLR